jgi:hypothetical protein
MLKKIIFISRNSLLSLKPKVRHCFHKTCLSVIRLLSYLNLVNIRTPYCFKMRFYIIPQQFAKYFILYLVLTSSDYISELICIFLVCGICYLHLILVESLQRYEIPLYVVISIIVVQPLSGPAILLSY